MRTLAASLAIFATALGAHAAEVVRCTDASGAISYTNVACPPGSKQSRQVSILESPPPEAARRDYSPQPGSAPPVVPPSQVASSPPSGPAIIPRYPADTQPQAAADPPGVVILSPDPYYDGVRPIRRPRPPHAQDPGPPPGQRPCQNLAGIKRYNC
ncbi:MULTISPECIES: hypothetical protein [unclassified Variovorax]|jgi:hypothetical protein|uniref:hypothetical protein n=1 Tax=unclassified Variovorax TaxID=663243 RepID=UPI000F7E679D|nr:MULTISPECIES: hypothetical protein [unclassified Variovorax]RSZ33205.1 hypothetical protein EJO70_28430 [Variovorax sp. 553]RSZ33576.1 hypothetical protein EJO71_28430 [Variovorax sp. 679]